MVLKYFSLLPDKRKTFPGEDDETKCCSVKNMEDIPEDIMDASKHLILKKEEGKTLQMEEFQQQIQTSLQSQQNQIDRIESQIQLLLQLCSKK